MQRHSAAPKLFVPNRTAPRADVDAAAHARAAIGPGASAPPMAWLSITMVLLTVTGSSQPPCRCRRSRRRARRARAAGPAAGRVVDDRAAGHEARRNEDQGDAAAFGECRCRPGAADRLIAGERAPGNEHGAAEEVEAEDAAAGGRTVAQDRLRGNDIRCQGSSLARLPVRVESRTVRVPILLMPPPWPEP